MSGMGPGPFEDVAGLVEVPPTGGSGERKIKIRHVKNKYFFSICIFVPLAMASVACGIPHSCGAVEWLPAPGPSWRWCSCSSPGLLRGFVCRACMGFRPLGHLLHVLRPRGCPAVLCELRGTGVHGAVFRAAPEPGEARGTSDSLRRQRHSKWIPSAEGPGAPGGQRPRHMSQ